MMTTSRALILLAAAAACSCSNPASQEGPTAPSPAAPGAAARGSASTIEPMRRVEETGGGGEVCGFDFCWPYPGGRVVLAASGGTLEGAYSLGAQRVGDVYRWEVGRLGGHLSLVGAGRLDGINGSMEISLMDTPRVLIQLLFPGGVQKITGSGVPAFKLEADVQCPSGQRLTTSFELTLEYLGKATITDVHCTATGSTP